MPNKCDCKCVCLVFKCVCVSLLCLLIIIITFIHFLWANLTAKNFFENYLYTLSLITRHIVNWNGGSIYRKIIVSDCFVGVPDGMRAKNETGVEIFEQSSFF